MKKIKKPLRSKQKPSMTAMKVILIVLTAVYPVFMTMLTGAGIISNRSSYGSTITRYGICLIISGIIMTAAAILCMSRRSTPNLIAAPLSGAGFALCITVLIRLIKHAESAGWTGIAKYEGVPVSDMYRTRIGPVIAPFLLTVLISALQYFSYDCSEERRIKREYRLKKENAPAPSIIGDDD
ncbi:MAG TPA: hypothetical protein P5191_08780 [Ruminococcus sp.]|nr:hypothetical protein [Ruminococcus sp.]